MSTILQFVGSHKNALHYNIGALNSTAMCTAIAKEEKLKKPLVTRKGCEKGHCTLIDPNIDPWDPSYASTWTRMTPSQKSTLLEYMKNRPSNLTPQQVADDIA